jgi:geranylgeranylglyceryl phosphate synthase family protein
MVYLEAGSGAPTTVPEEMIHAVRSQVDIPLIVGGGIRDAETARAKIEAGADIIVTGNLLQREDGLEVMREIAHVVTKA